MATLLIIGGDQLGAIPKHLESLGFKEINHIDGRKKSMIRKDIPDNTDLILILTDFINHNLAKKIKGRAEKRNIPICFSRRSWCSIYKTMVTCEHACEHCPFLVKDD
ncbi:DUF2325 domain-containing protein [Bacillus shivajii]|uniref:DUF2325 domain-containing protein n=1 Tax=Bacillus shivajii TaxID=1983719 RepID=UPI001CFC1056|nr:DUF2325 domain-containing protein [Bacillus shivajii]UCZ54199.1 DUF2325 domain-containing protein [Bacillus shivajii]